MQLFLNTRQKSVATITIPAGSTVDSSFSYTNNETGLIQGKLSLNDKQVVFDDHFFFTYQIEPFLQVASINSFAKAQDTLNYDIKNIFTNMEIKSILITLEINYLNLNEFSHR